MKSSSPTPGSTTSRSRRPIRTAGSPRCTITSLPTTAAIPPSRCASSSTPMRSATSTTGGTASSAGCALEDPARLSLAQLLPKRAVQVGVGRISHPADASAHGRRQHRHGLLRRSARQQRTRQRPPARRPDAEQLLRHPAMVPQRGGRAARHRGAAPPGGPRPEPVGTHRPRSPRSQGARQRPPHNALLCRPAR